MIVFGHGNFKIKTFTPEEIGAPVQEGNDDIEIQVRQRYAHLFWIPFFPIGKIWVIKKRGVQGMYHATDEIKALVKSQYKIRSPWYSYALIVLALVVGGLFMISEEMRSIDYENSFYKEQAINKMMIKYPISGDFYSCKLHDQADSYNATKVIFKVDSYDEESVVVTTKNADLNTDVGYVYDMKSEFKDADQYVFNSIKISKKELEQLITKDYNKYGDKKVKIASINRFVSLDNIERQKASELIEY